jgi:hypothetical protein
MKQFKVVMAEKDTKDFGTMKTFSVFYDGALVARAFTSPSTTTEAGINQALKDAVKTINKRKKWWRVW